jgi:hypothetical protein
MTDKAPHCNPLRRVVAETSAAKVEAVSRFSRLSHTLWNCHYNVVFSTEVSVPDSNRFGKPNSGRWSAGDLRVSWMRSRLEHGLCSRIRSYDIWKTGGVKLTV